MHCVSSPEVPLDRLDKVGRRFVPFREGGRGIAMTLRSVVSDSRKWADRRHVATEAEAALKLGDGWHLWMEREDGKSGRPSLITPASVRGWP